MDIAGLSPGSFQEIYDLYARAPNLRDFAIASNSAGIIHWYTVPGEVLKLRSLQVHGEALVEDHAAAWLDFTDWSRLERLSITNIRVLPSFIPYLVALKHLRLDVHYMVNKQLVPDFLLRCDRLEVVDLTGYTFPYESLQAIASHFWHIEHLELNLEIDIQFRGRDAWPKATLTSVAQIWTYMRKAIRQHRTNNHHLVAEPRLRSLDVVAGPYRPFPPLGAIGKWELKSQQRFAVDLAERDDEARYDIAKVRCVESEALESKFGHGEPVFLNDRQRQLYQMVLDRANEGNGTRKLNDWELFYDWELTPPSSFWELHDPLRFFY
ncbi:MAG: hypothetical protein Q9217_004161 [Psora testacea]